MEKSSKSFQKFMILWAGEFVSAIGSGLTAGTVYKGKWIDANYRCCKVFGISSDSRLPFERF